MKVETASDQLYFGTTRLECLGADKTTSGTGFFVVVEARSSEASQTGSVPFLVTNRHVAEAAMDCLRVHLIGQTGEQPPAPQLGKRVGVDILEAYEAFQCHPDAGVDVAVISFGEFAERLSARGTPPFFKSVGAEQMLTQRDADELDSLEEVIFVGYPSNLHDASNLTPIVRTGTTATPIMVDYDGLPAFLIDASVFPGSSGSPVFLRDRGIYRSRSGEVHLRPRFKLLGVVAAVHTRAVEAELGRIATAFGVTFQDPLNLGVVFKAAAILDCIDLALERYDMARVAPR